MHALPCVCNVARVPASGPKIALPLRVGLRTIGLPARACAVAWLEIGTAQSPTHRRSHRHRRDVAYARIRVRAVSVEVRHHPKAEAQDVIHRLPTATPRRRIARRSCRDAFLRLRVRWTRMISTLGVRADRVSRDAHERVVLTIV